MKKFLLLGTLFICGLSAHAQVQVGLAYMNELWQSNLVNPANLPEHRLIIMLPSVGNTLSFSGPTYGDAIVESNGQTVLDVDAIIASLEDRNELREQLQIGTLGASFGLGKVQVSIYHQAKFEAFLDYPKELPELIWKGNAQFIGETIPLGNKLQIMGYHEIGLGGTIGLGKVQLGARLKYLSGIGDMSTSKEEASLFTDPEFYQLTFEADYELQTASSLDYRAFNDFDLNFNFGQLSMDKLFSGNAGFAVDLGAKIDLGRLDLGASILDIGSINWKKEVRTFSANGSYTYDGLDISQALTGDSVSFEQALDTLQQIFQFEEDNNSYKTTLSPKAYVTAGYHISNMWEVGAVLSGEFRENDFMPSTAIYGKAEVGPWLRLGASYAITRNTYDNLGLSANLRLGPVQVYAMTDNIISAFDPSNSRYFNFLAGVNIVLGKRAWIEKEESSSEPGIRF